MEKNGWSQTELAREIGVTFATVNRWLRGHTTPQQSQLLRIDALFKNTVGIIPVSDEEITRIISEVDCAKNKFPDIMKILQNEKIAEEFLLELTYNSDSIEGSTLTKKETEAIIFDKASIKNKSLIEHLEATNHSVIVRDIFTGKFSPPVTEALIKRFHNILMQGIREDAGEYSKYQRNIRGVDLALPHPEDIPEEMELYIKKVNRLKNHPIEHIAGTHADFEAIHPFGDGNGRVGRLIVIMQLISCGYAPCIISVNRKAKYYECLEYAQKKSETHLAYFLADTMLKSYKLIEKLI